MYVLLLLVAALPMFWALKQVKNGYWAYQLRTSGVPTAATVFLGSVYKDPAKYQFKVNGVAYYGTSGKERKGAMVRVLYLPGDPIVNRPADDLIFDMVFGAAVGVGAVALVIVAAVGIARAKPAQAVEPDSSRVAIPRDS